MTIKWDIAAWLTAIGMVVAAIVYVVSLQNKLDELERTKSDNVDVAAIKTSLEAKATTAEVGVLRGKVTALEGDKDYSSIVAKKEAALADFESAVALARAELADIEAKKGEILEQIAREIDLAKNVRTQMVKVVDEKLAAQQLEVRKQIAGILETRVTQVEDILQGVHSSVKTLSQTTQNITSNDCTTSISLGNKRQMIFQCDGNVVVYRVGGDGKALWNSRTHVRLGQP